MPTVPRLAPHLWPALRRSALAGPTLLCMGIALAACAPRPRTQVMVFVEADEEIDALSATLDVRVHGGAMLAELRAEQTLGSADRPVEYPVRVALVPVANDATRTYRVEVTARDAVGRELLGARVVSGFLPQRTLRLELPLEACCRGRICPENETCRDCACSSDVVEPEDLEDYFSDAGRAAPVDADAVDTGALDAIALDTAPMDAGSDAPVAMPDAGICGVDCQRFGSVTSPGNTSLGHRGTWAPPLGSCPASALAATADHGYGAVYFYSEGPSRNDLLLTPDPGIVLVLYDVPSPTMGTAIPSDPRACRAMSTSSISLSLLAGTTVLVVASRTSPGTQVGYRFSYEPF